MKLQAGLIFLVGTVLVPTLSMAQTPGPLVWTGDARVRLHHELDMTDPAATAEDDLMRIRLRLGASSKITETVSAAFRFTTGANLGAKGATSDSQTLGELGGKKQFGLDLMYLSYRALEGFDVQGGQMPNNFWSAGKNEMVWSSVTTFDGAQVRYVGGSDSFKPFASATYATEYNRNSTAPADVNLLAVQAGSTFKSGDFAVAAAVANYAFSNVKGADAVSELGGTSHGDSLNGTKYANDYKLIDAGLELAYNLAFAPITAYAEYVQNQDPSDFNKGMIAGLRIGNLKDAGSWYVDYNYRDVQKDAVFANLSDATFLNGSSGVMGHAVKVGYQIAPALVTSVYYTFGDRLSNPTPPKAPVSGHYELVLWDLVASF